MRRYTLEDIIAFGFEVEYGDGDTACDSVGCALRGFRQPTIDTCVVECVNEDNKERSFHILEKEGMDTELLKGLVDVFRAHS